MAQDEGSKTKKKSEIAIDPFGEEENTERATTPPPPPPVPNKIDFEEPEKSMNPFIQQPEETPQERQTESISPEDLPFDLPGEPLPPQSYGSEASDFANEVFSHSQHQDFIPEKEDTSQTSLPAGEPEDTSEFPPLPVQPQDDAFPETEGTTLSLDDPEESKDLATAVDDEDGIASLEVGKTTIDAESADDTITESLLHSTHDGSLPRDTHQQTPPTKVNQAGDALFKHSAQESSHTASEGLNNAGQNWLLGEGESSVEDQAKLRVHTPEASPESQTPLSLNDSALNKEQSHISSSFAPESFQGNVRDSEVGEYQLSASRQKESNYAETSLVDSIPPPPDLSTSSPVKRQEKSTNAAKIKQDSSLDEESKKRGFQTDRSKPKRKPTQNRTPNNKFQRTIPQTNPTSYVKALQAKHNNPNTIAGMEKSRFFAYVAFLLIVISGSLFVLVEDGFFEDLMDSDYADFLEPTQVGLPAEPLPAPLTPPPTNPKAKPKPLKNKKKISTASPRATATTALPESPNNPLFTNLEKAIEKGDTISAIRLFKKPLAAPLKTPAEHIKAAELQSRYLFLVGKPQQARQKLKTHCQDISQDNVFSCLHYVRSLIKLGVFTKSKVLLKKIATLNADQSLEPSVKLLSQAARTLSQPSFPTVKRFINQGQASDTLSGEWSRQRYLWLVKAMLLLDEPGQQRMIKNLRDPRANPSLQAIRGAKGSSSVDGSHLWINFLNWQGRKFEVNQSDLSSAIPEKPTQYNYMSRMFHILAQSYHASSQQILSEASRLKSNKSFKELAKVVELNLRIREGNWKLAASHISDMKGANGKVPFVVDWVLGIARYTYNTTSPNSWRKALQQMNALERQLRSSPDNFDFTLAKIRLLRKLKRKRTRELNTLKKLATTPRRRGFYVVEEAYVLKDKGKVKEATRKLSQTSRQVPYHPELSRVTAEFVGQTGGNASQYIFSNQEIPNRFLTRSAEFNLISLFSILKITKNI